MELPDTINQTLNIARSTLAGISGLAIDPKLPMSLRNMAASISNAAGFAEPTPALLKARQHALDQVDVLAKRLNGLEALDIASTKADILDAIEALAKAIQTAGLTEEAKILRL